MFSVAEQILWIVSKKDVFCIFGKWGSQRIRTTFEEFEKLPMSVDLPCYDASEVLRALGAFTSMFRREVKIVCFRSLL